MLGAFTFSDLGGAGSTVGFAVSFVRLGLGSFEHFLVDLLEHCLGSNQQLLGHLAAAAVVTGLDDSHFCAFAASAASPWPTTAES